MSLGCQTGAADFAARGACGCARGRATQNRDTEKSRKRGWAEEKWCHTPLCLVASVLSVPLCLCGSIPCAGKNAAPASWPPPVPLDERGDRVGQPVLVAAKEVAVEPGPQQLVRAGQALEPGEQVLLACREVAARRDHQPGLGQVLEALQ